MLINKPLILSTGSGVAPAHTIDQSIRFNSSDSTYMQRTHGAGGNTDKWTVSFWIKKGDHSLSASQFVFGSGANTSNTFDLYFESSPVDTLAIQDYAGAYNVQLKTTQVFRDPSAWYHIVYVYDSGNAVSTERARLYVNGQRVTDFGTETYPSQNQDSIVGTNVNIGFGRYISNGSNYFNGYLAEMNYVNGSALDPSSFGEYNSSNIWIPKEYSGSYGTGGFYIKGEDSSDLGNDSSGNGNDMTTSGLATHDQVLDSPTNNFSTLNPLIPGLGLTTVTYSEGNLKVTFSNNDATESTIGIPSSGKWYFEGYVIDTTYFRDDVQTAIGLRPEGFSHQRDDVNETGFAYGQNGKKIEGDGSSGSASSYGASYSADDIIGVAVDMDASPATLTFYKNNASQGTAFTFTDKTIFRFGSVAQRNSSGWILNFGQDSTFAGENVNANDYSNYDGTSDGNGVGSFFYTPPTGHLAICTKNLGS